MLKMHDDNNNNNNNNNNINNNNNNKNLNYEILKISLQCTHLHSLYTLFSLVFVFMQK